MSSPLTLRDLSPLDILVIRDLVRFGVLTEDQIQRRYHDPSLARDRLSALVEAELVEPWLNFIQDTSAFSATMLGTAVSRCGLSPRRPSLDHLRHDIAVVDLADYLLSQNPRAEWRTEREVGRFLRGNAKPRNSPLYLTGSGHRPDGLLILDGHCLAIELEHTPKSDKRYADICRWFALNPRVNGVRWYVDDERIIVRLQRVATDYGFAGDVPFTFQPFPPGVALRPWRRA